MKPDPLVLHAEFITRLKHGDLDQIAPYLESLGIPFPPTRRANLKVLMDAVRDREFSIYTPLADREHFLRALWRQTDGRPVTPQTAQTRLYHLRWLYRHLRTLQLLSGDPLIDFKLPTAPPADPTARPVAEHVHALLARARPDDALHAAMMLITTHALTGAEIVGLHWQDYDYEHGTVKRKAVLTPLTPAANAAMMRLRARVGGELAYQAAADAKKVFPYEHPHALRYRLMVCAREADVRFIPPRALRNHAIINARNPAEAGFSSEIAFAKARERARQAGVLEG